MTQDTSGAQAESQAHERNHEVSECPRCGVDHGEQSFTKLVRPMRAGGATFEWWWTCPTTGEPVIAEFPPREGDA